MKFTIYCMSDQTTFTVDEDTTFPIECPHCHQTNEDGVLWVIA